MAIYYRKKTTEVLVCFNETRVTLSVADYSDSLAPENMDRFV